MVRLNISFAQDLTVSFLAKSALVRILRTRTRRRRVYIPSPPLFSKFKAVAINYDNAGGTVQEDEENRSKTNAESTVQDDAAVAPIAASEHNIYDILVLFAQMF